MLFICLSNTRCPIELPSIHGIANNIVKTITNNLLNKKLNKPNNTKLIMAKINYERPIIVNSNISNKLDNKLDNELDRKIDKNKRLIVYFSRDIKGIRGVLNEREILDAMGISLYNSLSNSLYISLYIFSI